MRTGTLAGFPSLEFSLIFIIAEKKSVSPEQPTGTCREVRAVSGTLVALVTSGCGWAKLTRSSLQLRLVGDHGW